MYLYYIDKEVPILYYMYILYFIIRIYSNTIPLINLYYVCISSFSHTEVQGRRRREAAQGRLHPAVGAGKLGSGQAVRLGELHRLRHQCGRGGAGLQL